LPRIIWWLNFLAFKVDIDHRAELYGALYLPHPMMIVIGKDVKLSGAAKIMQGVTIGGNLGKSEIIGDTIFTQPVMCGSIFIGANALIFGPIWLSGRVFISAQTVCSKNFETSLIFGTNQSRAALQQHEKELYEL